MRHAGIVLGLAGPQRVNGVAGHAFKYFPRGAKGAMNRFRLVQNYSAVTAAHLVIRREVFAQAGGFDAVPWHLLEGDHKNFFTPPRLRTLLGRHFPRVEALCYSRHPLATPEGLPLYYHLFADALA